MSSENVMKQYFPYTNKCLVDGEECVQNNSCKFWLSNTNESRCWLIGFEEFLKTFFGDVDIDYIMFEDKNGKRLEGLCFVDFRLSSNDKLDKQEIELEIRICFNSSRLATKIREKFGLLQWSIEPFNYDGGDDTGLVMKCSGQPENKSELEKTIIFIRDKFVPEFVEAEKEINTCAICKKKCQDLIEYNEIAICSICENKIILDHISSYL